jgi:formylglycine-generating enzyme required for sulfatase activity
MRKKTCDKPREGAPQEMSMKRLSAVLGVLLAGTLAARAQTSVVIESFEWPGQITFTKLSTATQYRVEWSSSAGTTWTSFAAAATSLDAIVSPGPGVVTAAVPMLYRVVATVPVNNMALIPAGSFVMGNATNVFAESEGGSDELPQHTVYVSAFYMDPCEVTKALWDEVKAFNGGNGYSYSYTGGGKATNHPVHAVSWYDAVKWCNARSQRDALTPVYYTDAGFTTVYKTGGIDPYANWAANGYRLPTEAEWEKAARGGTADTRFPWTDFTNNISWAKANYYGHSREFSYDLDGDSGAYHPTFATGGEPYTSPVGYFGTNGYSLYDMAGNVMEWCWDWYDAGYYSSSPGTDPRGPVGAFSQRVLRGGSWGSNASWARVADRWVAYPDSADYTFGFRCARGL